MDQNTAKLLEQLSHQLGTTSEYLWGILLKQAPISAAISIFQIALIAGFGVILYKIHMLCKNNDSYDESDHIRMLMVILAFVEILFIILGLILIVPNILNGFLNPEYWALHEIMKHIR